MRIIALGMVLAALACPGTVPAAPMPARPPCAAFGLDTDTLLQIALERSGFSVNCIDGSWGARSEAALRAWFLAHGLPLPQTREQALATVSNLSRPYKVERVMPADYAALVSIPNEPREKARLDFMGYESLLEMYAERGHTSRRALERMNPAARWPNPPVGTLLRIPNVTTTNAPPKAALVRVNLAEYSVSAYDAAGHLLARFPCSIAADKRNLPPVGEIHVQGIAPQPNYTYTAPSAPGARKQRYIYPAGPNNPVGSAWVGLSIPSYGIHGTPSPETVGRPESHGCFRLANWNAVRLAAMVEEGTRVIIE